MNITSFLSKIESFFKKPTTPNSSKNNDGNFDISIDTVHDEYKKIPKKIVSSLLALVFLVMALSTIFVVQERSVQTKQRDTVDKNQTKADEVQIKIDEQAWKHYQNKKLELLGEKTDKQLDEIREESRRNSEKMTQEVKEDLKTTLENVESLAIDIKTSVGEFKEEISNKIDKEIAKIDGKFENKINDNKKLIEKEKGELAAQIKAANINSEASSDSKLSPPPLKNLKQPVKVVKKIQYTEPGSKDYSYSNVSIDKMEITQSDAKTASFNDKSDNNGTGVKFHIMKGLVRATLLTGINASTFGGADSKKNQPVLFSVDGDTVVANDETQTIENCLIGGSATGNVNNSTAEILLTDISCSGYDTHNNKIKFEQKIDGWVIGENGSFGLEGRLLDSSGKVITKMIALEIINSLSKTMQASALPSGTITTLGGSGANIPYDDAAQRGLGTGVSKGINKAFEHYNQILSGMYPTISVMAGKKISLYLKGGEDLKAERYNSINVYEKINIESEIKK